LSGRRLGAPRGSPYAPSSLESYKKVAPKKLSASRPLSLGCSGGNREERSPSECDSLRLSTARENAKEHKHNKDDHDDPDDSADRKEHSERCEHSRLLVSVSVSSPLAGLQNESSRAVVARLLGRKL
jgi:hypothetical protein